MLRNLFEGLNVTIFGLGKTLSIGTSYGDEGNMGVISRALHEIFNYIKNQLDIHFTIKVSFMELYREMLYNYLANKAKNQCILEIRAIIKVAP